MFSICSPFLHLYQSKKCIINALSLSLLSVSSKIKAGPALCTAALLESLVQMLNWTDHPEALELTGTTILNAAKPVVMDRSALMPASTSVRRPALIGPTPSVNGCSQIVAWKRPFSCSHKYGKEVCKKERGSSRTGSSLVRMVLRRIVVLFLVEFAIFLKATAQWCLYISQFSFLIRAFSRVKLSAGRKTAINQALFRGVFLCFQMPDAACYMKCPRRIFHSDSVIA